MGESETVTPYPDFESPPVIETVLGVQFAPIAGWDAPRMGLFWDRVRRDFPKVSVQPPLAGKLEDQTPGAPFRPEVTLELGGQPNPRFWLMDEPESRLIQLQRDRFVQNWRRTPSSAYPRYSQLKSEFRERWDSLIGFMHDEKLGAPKVQQCEVTYVNHIDQGAGWDSVVDLPDVFTCLRPLPGDRFLADPAHLTLNISFAMADEAGRLRAEIAPVIRTTGESEQATIQFRLIAKGTPRDSSVDEILSWMDVAREHVVRGFVDLTTKRMHEIWKRKA